MFYYILKNYFNIFFKKKFDFIAEIKFDKKNSRMKLSYTTLFSVLQEAKLKYCMK